ncbi:DUF402 domain-containing protein [Kutzneria viridogrisea]
MCAEYFDMTVQLPVQDRGQRAEGVATAAHPHPPKVEVFDLAARTNTDPKGHVRQVEVYRLRGDALYMSRPVVGHPQLSHFESWLLPAHGLRVTRQSWTEGNERDYEFYVDVVDVEPGQDRWRTTDLYLDLLVRTGRGVQVLDVDELLEAVDAGLLGRDAAERALAITYRAVGGIAAHGYDIQRWLAEEGVPLDWRTDSGSTR